MIMDSADRTLAFDIPADSAAVAVRVRRRHDTPARHLPEDLTARRRAEELTARGRAEELSARGRAEELSVRELAEELVVAAHELRDTATERERAAMAVSAYNCALRLLRQVAHAVPADDQAPRASRLVA